MTTDDRFERIEHVTAGLAEERRKDREEYRQLWRDTQRQITETNAAVAALAFKIADTNDAVARVNDTVARLADAGHATDARIEKLVSAIGELLTRRQ